MKKNLVRMSISMFILIVFATSAYPQWVQTNWSESNIFFKLYSNEDIVFARIWDISNGGRVFFTDDNGTNWTQLSSAKSDIDILSIVTLNNDIIAGTWKGFYKKTIEDTNWEAFMPSGIPADTAILSLAIIDNSLFAGTDGNIYKSSINNINNWTKISTGIPANARIISIIANDNSVFAISDSDTIFVSLNGGTSWTPIKFDIPNTHISQLAAMGNKLFLITLENGVFVSNDNGMNWTQDSSSPKNINCLLAVNDKLFAGTDSNGVYLSDDSGLNWIPVSPVMPDNTRVWSMAANSDNIFAGTTEGIWKINPQDINFYIITADASEGGSISPEGEVSVLKNTSQTFTITPASGYRIRDVVVDGSSEGEISSYTFSDVNDNHTITAAFVVPSYQINCGGGSSDSFAADKYYDGGLAYSVAKTINTIGVSEPAPEAVYRTERYFSTMTYTFPNLTSGTSYKVRLHFSENYWSSSGKRRFNVTINETKVLSNYDIYSETGAIYKAVVKEFTTTANTSGQIVIKFESVSYYAKIGGIEIIPQ